MPSNDDHTAATSHVPESCRSLLEEDVDLRTAIPDLARDSARMNDIQAAVESLPTDHCLETGDARNLQTVEAEGVELVVTSPPYFDLKEYEDTDGQLGHVSDYDEFSEFLADAWRECYDALVPGGRLCVVVGDVLRSRSEYGRHRVVPLHARIQELCREIGFDALAPIIWQKVGNASPESGDNARFLGKPYEPGAVVQNDIEYVLLFRKPGGYRSPTTAQRILSVIDADRHQRYFTQVWTDISGASRDGHPAPYPVKLAERLVRMFSFVGDTVLDPFAGTGTTSVAASRVGRDSISVEVSPEYVRQAKQRLENESKTLVNLNKMTVEA